MATNLFQTGDSYFGTSLPNEGGGLIPLQDNNGKKAVSARALYDFLGCTERFQSWFDRQLQYGFTESIDYQGCKVFNTLANQELTDYAMTISMAKEVSMIQRTERGKQARQYFIACEEKLQEIMSPSYMISDPIKRAEKWIENVENEIAAMKKEREENGKLLLSLSLSPEVIPQLSIRDNIRQLVNRYAEATNTATRDVYHKIYNQLYYLYHISINNYKKVRRDESKLEIAERNHFLDKVFNIASNLVREANISC